MSTDLDSALARFDELADPKPRLENDATRIGAQLADAYNRRDLDAYLSLASPDGLFIDRRHGLHSELEASLRQNLQSVFDVSPNSFEMTWEPIATRGSRLALAHEVWADRGQEDHPIAVELLTVTEVSGTGLLHVGVAFDLDDIDEAFAELETQYLAGEAAGNEVWAEVSQSYATMNRHEIPPTMSNWTTVDHRVRETFDGGELTAYTRSAWNLIPDVSIRVETVHRLTDRGAVATHVAYGTSDGGFEAEWRMIVILVLCDDGRNRCELFNESDLDAALARFDELDRLASEDPDR